VVWGLVFITERIDLCRIGLLVLSEASAKVTQAVEEEVQLFVNMPSWLAPRRNSFALGHEGYTVLPEYTDTGLDDFVYANTGIKREVWAKSFPDTRRHWRALIGSLRKIRIDAAGSELKVDLHWRLLQAMKEPYTVFVHVYSEDGRLLAQGDGLPLGGLFPFRLWKPGDMVHDIRYVTLPEDLDPSEYAVGIGLYRSDTGERAPAIDGKGRMLAEEMLRVAAIP
jgi:hypothetical protein